MCVNVYDFWAPRCCNHHISPIQKIVLTRIGGDMSVRHWPPACKNAWSLACVDRSSGPHCAWGLTRQSSWAVPKQPGGRVGTARPRRLGVVLRAAPSTPPPFGWPCDPNAHTTWPLSCLSASVLWLLSKPHVVNHTLPSASGGAMLCASSDDGLCAARTSNTR